ncbi:MAG: LON peptidase substrate-binding domain-containing protein [Bryobacteraceae bacterium]|nr:LON peptidase substrate-binding domain-containing protein [Bryobacteraceae bacterium]
MHGGLLPLFPLEVVLFPRTPLPLHIFEDRYKEMIGEALEESSEFGIVLVREKGILNVGCTAVVQEVVRRYDDGRMDIVVAGRRRFEVFSLDEERSFLRGQVEMFDDEDAREAEPEIRQAAVDACLALRHVLGEHVPDAEMADRQLSFQLAQWLPDLDLRQLLLRSKSERERLHMLADNVPTLVVRQRYASHVQKVAPQNGHGKAPR